LTGCQRPPLAPGHELVLADSQGRIRASLALPDGRFSHVFVHSINLSLVEERFRVGEADQLLLGAVAYADTSSGMPSEAEGGFRLVDGRFILDLAREFSQLPIRVSPVPGHGIQTAESFFAFTDFFETGDLVLVRVKRR